MDECKRELEEEHPLLKSGSYRRTSKCTDEYNCFAFAAGDTNNWWEPTKIPPCVWPVKQHDYKPESFVEAFETLGFKKVTDCKLEDGFETIAVFLDEDGDINHAAVQREDGKWHSKCGKRYDIVHDLDQLNYGSFAFYMRRARVERLLPVYSDDDECEFHKHLSEDDPFWS